MSGHSGEPFKPLDFIRAVLDDGDLTTAETLFLTAVAISTDNATHKVRRSLRSLAPMVKVHRDSVSRMLKRERVTRYLRVEHHRRRTDLWAYLPGQLAPERRQATETTEGQLALERRQGGPATSDDWPLNVAPSASTSALSSATTDEPIPDAPVPDALCWECGEVGCNQECVESVSPEPETEVEPMSDCSPAHSLAMKCPECYKPGPQPKGPEWKRRQGHNRHLRSEGLDENGEPLPKRERRQGSAFTRS